MNKITRWEKIKFPNISENFLISPEGFVRFKDIDETLCMSADYHSSNGYDYILLMNTKQKLQLFPIDELIATELLEILKNNDLSPAKAFENIKNDINFKNITIHDLKYLKRKYFKS